MISWLVYNWLQDLPCILADEMGLGKTLQVLALLSALKRQAVGQESAGQEGTGPALAVVPASLLGNWQAEAKRFAPELAVRVAHASAAPPQVWRPELPAIITLCCPPAPPLLHWPRLS